MPPDTWEENPSQEKWEKYENDLKKWEEDMKNCTRGERFCFCFYNKDHLGSNREVVIAEGGVYLKYKNVKARPTAKAIMHYRAGQKRYAKSTIQNARKRLKTEIENFKGKIENSLSSIFSAVYSFHKRQSK